MYQLVLRRLLFLLPAESAHTIVMGLLAVLGKLPGVSRLMSFFFDVEDDVLKVQGFGATLKSPVGLAAGLDKDARAFETFAALGFGFVEIGTVTYLAQPGNPRPRLFRLPRDRALINRMGFNNPGAAKVAGRLARRRRPCSIVGANIGRSKLVSNEAALDDYVRTTSLLAPFVQYVVVNVSSPNTPELRALQARARLEPLLRGVRQALDQSVPERRVPLLVKLAPDLMPDELDGLATMALELSLDGIIVTNTTISREGLETSLERIDAYGSGGLSGAPLGARAVEVLRHLSGRLGKKLPLIAVGGISSADDAWQRLCLGASLVQIYTALIYEGPGLVSKINRELARRTREVGLASISEVVGREDLIGRF